MLHWLMGILVFAWCSVGQCPRSVAGELRIEFKELAAVGQAVLDGTRLQIHTDARESTNSPTRLLISHGTQQYTFGIPPIMFETAGASYAYRPADISLSSIDITATKGAIRVSVPLGSEELTLLGHCEAGLCLPPGFLPEIRWSTGAITIDLAPVRSIDMLSFEVKRIDLKGAIDPRCPTPAGLIATGLCNAALPAVRQAISRRSRDLHHVLKNKLNSPAVQQWIAEGLKSRLFQEAAARIRVRRVAVDEHGIGVSFCVVC